MKNSRRMRRLLVVTAVGLLVGSAGPAAALSGGGASKSLRKAVTVSGIMKHQQALQNVASANGNTRLVSTPGFTQSVDYVVATLKKAGYTPQIENFDFPFFQETAPPTFARVLPTPAPYPTDAFATMTYSGSGDVTGTVQNVDLVLPPGPTPSSSNSGCEAADFAGFTAGNVALLQRGTCTFGDKAKNAQAAGASAVIIFNEGQEGRTDTLDGTLGAPGFTIPVIGTSFAVGNELAASTGSSVKITTQTISETRVGQNVLANTKRGNPNNVIVVGAHLDSVDTGPGINDNGSGSSTLLETAVQIGKGKLRPKNQVRFAWWGAEELGLLGSEAYVAALTDAEKAKIWMNLNFDMIASPNFARFVYDGDGSATPDAGPAGSAAIEKVFTDYFAGQGLATEPTAFDGRSDYGPFIEAGIPAGGLFTGAEGLKTAPQVELYGGVLGEAYDRCYHQACDTISNLNLQALDEMSDAVVHSVATWARAKERPSASASPAVGALRGMARAQAKRYNFDRRGSHFIR